jgi:uncharacterized protein (DUF1501 family)
MDDITRTTEPRQPAMDRRQVLRAGALAALGLSLPLLEARRASAAPRVAGRASRCIVLFINGGPSHLDTFDPKPDAPAAIRGEFGAVSTCVPGIQVCEHLPRLARLADRYAILRSVIGTEAGHERARRAMLAGSAEPGALAVAALSRRATWLPQPPRSMADPAERAATRAALDVAREPTRTRERYGCEPFAEDCLRARRLVEAGARFVTVSFGGWDTHGANFPLLRERQLPVLDLAFSALLADLETRGLLDDTLVVWMGEFGRTPRVNPYGGRDHFPQAHSVILAGGGIRGGQVVGATDATASEVTERPVTPRDLAATLCHLLGLASGAPGRGVTELLT